MPGFNILTDSKGAQAPNSIARSFGVDIERISGSAVAVVNDWHGKMIAFAGACTVTIPAGLRSDFSCGWSQDGEGVITFAAGDGATVQSMDDSLESAGQYAIGGIAAFGDNTYRLFGELA